MPKISKQLISKYIKTGCKRFLALSLYRGKNEEAFTQKYNMPEPIVARPATNIFKIAGKNAEDLLYELIEEEFNGYVFNLKNKKTNMKDLLTKDFRSELFILEAEFVTDNLLEIFLNQFNSSMGDIKDSLDISDIRPDIIARVIPVEDETYYEVLSDGTLKVIQGEDNRVMLSIFDVKNTEKSNTGYDAEIIFYAILLTIWLKENNLSKQYVVTHKNGIFPAALKVNPFLKTYEPLKNESLESKYYEFLSHIEYIQHDQIAITFRKILLDDIIPILKEPERWESLEWHIGKKCGLCDWLGYNEWLSEENKQKVTEYHCFPQALSIDHISQIPYVTSAMGKVLSKDNINTIEDIGHTDGTEESYQKHSRLKIDSNMIPARAKAILNNRKIEGDRLIYDIPKYYTTFTNIFITLNFDPSTRIVSSISTKCYWREFSSYEDRERYTNSKNFPSQVFFTENGDSESETEMLFLFLRKLSEYFDFANSPENNPHPDFKRSTYHVYFWDRTQYEEIRRLIGKYIGVILSNELYKPLIWLFGSEKVLEDFSNIKAPNVSFVKDALRTNMALNLKFDYTLLEVAKAYTAFSKNISKAFHDPFSDYIPKERLYEIWLKYKNYQETKDRYRWTAKAQVEGLQFIAVQIHKDLHSLIKGEPSEINFDIFENFRNIKNLPIDSKLWYLHQRLNEVYSERDNEFDSFKHARELEAEYKAIVLEQMLVMEERKQWLNSVGLIDKGSIFIYEVTDDSRDAKIKDNASNLSLGIYDDPLFLVQKFGKFMNDNGYSDIEDFLYLYRQKMSNVFQVDIIYFDRVNGIIAIMPNKYKKASAFLIENIDMNKKLYLVDLDTYKTSKYTLQYIKSIRTPLISHTEESVLSAIGLQEDIKGKKTHKETMAARILWNSKELQSQSSEYNEQEIVSAYNNIVGNMEKKPNDRQKEAIMQSLSRRLSIIWGPPGTGKTQTASILLNIFLSLVVESNSSKNILISALTYQACVELFNKLYPLLDNKFENIDFVLLHSKQREEFLGFENKVPSWMNLITVDTFSAVKDSLLENFGTRVIVAPIATLNSLFNDGDFSKPKYNNIGEYIDFALLDEASQCDIANSLSVLYGLKDGAQMIVLGDHLQMPPIHKIKPPISLEYHVGSLLNYLRERFDIKPTMLNVNYRSVPNIVRYIATLGYDNLVCDRKTASLVMGNNNIVDNPYKERLNNDDLFQNILKEGYDVSAITYTDGVSSQANLFEATMVAATIVEAYNKFYSNGNCETKEYNKWFWNNAVGIVTPHKAQKALIGRLLEEVFSDQKAYIHNAIDTVERFQGGQRKLIIVSFGVGDPDIIVQEEEFLLNLNRTNVAISRAEDRVMVFISEELIHHLPEDKEIIQTSKAIKSYVHQYCLGSRNYTVDFEKEKRKLNFRVHVSSNH